MIKKAFMFLILGLLLVGSVSAYYCFDVEDNDEVKTFKSNMNRLAINNDIESNSLTEDAFKIKLKYFYNCN